MAVTRAGVEAGTRAFVPPQDLQMLSGILGGLEAGNVGVHEGVSPKAHMGEFCHHACIC